MPVSINGATLGQSTKDATALPEDVLSGKIFYGIDGKSLGTWEPKVTDYTSDATASPSDVKNGKVFYNNQGKQTGSNELFSNSLFADLKILNIPSCKAKTSMSRTDVYDGKPMLEFKTRNGRSFYDGYSYVELTAYSSSDMTYMHYFSCEMPVGYKLVGVDFGKASSTICLHKTTFQNNNTNYCFISDEIYPTDYNSSNWSENIIVFSCKTQIYVGLVCGSGGMYNIKNLSQIPSFNIYLAK